MRIWKIHYIFWFNLNQTLETSLFNGWVEKLVRESVENGPMDTEPALKAEGEAEETDIGRPLGGKKESSGQVEWVIDEPVLLQGFF